MNFFCFSLEGSTDSLDEPAYNKSIIQEIVPNRHPSSILQRKQEDRHGSDPCISLELPQTLTSDHKKKKRRSQMLVPSLDNESLDMSPVPSPSTLSVVDDRVERPSSERRDRITSPQEVNFEAWNPNYERHDSHQQYLAEEAEGEIGETRDTLKRFQKLVGVKKGSQSALEDRKHSSESNGHFVHAVFRDDSPMISCIGLSRRSEKKTSKAFLSPQQPRAKDSCARNDSHLSPEVHDRLQSPAQSPRLWEPSFHTCHCPVIEHRACNLDYIPPWGTAWDHFESLVQELDSKQSELYPPRVIRSITDLDFSECTGLSSLNRFEGLGHETFLTKTEGIEPTEGSDSCKPDAIGKKMKAISQTMCKRIGRTHVNAERTGEETDSGREEDSGGAQSFPMEHRPSRNSLASFYSFSSGQSSSSGVTSGSEGSSNRDSLRLEEQPSNKGQFCGRARVHTDFVPSPYDTDSLQLKVGDEINIISKPAMGIWTGKLNNKIGNFKFVYVDVLAVKRQEEPQKTRTRKKSQTLSFKTLQELLEHLTLETYTSSLLLHGYQTVDDLRNLKEEELIELGVTDPEQRHRLLAAIHCFQEPQYDRKCGVARGSKSSSDSIKAELNSCPRDSGCYMPSDCFEAGKDDPDHHPPLADTRTTT